MGRVDRSLCACLDRLDSGRTESETTLINVIKTVILPLACAWKTNGIEDNASSMLDMFAECGPKVNSL